ncbi:recombinase family protein [Streptomyces pakalii]|uniref:Recombinase family protein n=1 Tax=Streptomyces pakalii TaxID=3036494 RepID=A0ABT7DFA7_9ACTN|nr:recombinase family protein [Streptomyces pakalii]MDJ1644502.1 recombinase family protein [Streptomyces pakalii]
MAGTSRSFLNPQLITALAQGKTFDEWLAGRVPGIDYARISGDQAVRSATRAMTREAGTGVRHQHEGNEETAEEHNIAIVKYYEDNNITAADPDVFRPSFLEMTKALLHRKTSEGYPIRAVIATEYQRVWRLPEDYLRFRRAVISDNEGVFIERGKPYDIRSTGGHIVGLVNSGVSEGEVSDTKDRIMRNQRRRQQDGTTPGGRRRFGYLGPNHRIGRPANTKIDKKEEPWARFIIDSALSKRAWKTIARELNENKIAGASGKPWSGETVRQWAINPTNYGYRAVKGELVRDRKGKLVQGKWEAIGTLDEWELVRGITVSNGAQKGVRLSNGGGKQPRPPEYRATKYLFSGFLLCGRVRKTGSVCHYKMGGQRRHVTSVNPKGFLYVCTHMDCMGISRNGTEVDAHLEELIIRALEARYKTSRPKVKNWEGEERLRELREKKATLSSRWMEGHLSDEDFYRLNTEISERVEALEVDKIEHQATETRENEFSGWDRSKWKDMDLAQKRLAVGRIIEAVIVMPIPEGRSRRAPFDPNLLKIIPRR